MEFLKLFFEFDSPVNSTVVGHCQMCNSQYKDKAGSTGNFHKHLKRKHSKQYDRERKQTRDASNSDQDGTDDQQLNNIDQKINESVTLNLIVKCNLPPSVIEQSGFRAFMKLVAPKWKPSSSRYMKTNTIPTLVSFLRRKIDMMLNDIENLSITTDIWTDRRGKAFIGITGHFLDIDFRSQAVLLDFVRLKCRHTGENIRNVTEDILEKLKITRKIYRIITDNASNMIKAYKFGLSVVADDHPNQSTQENYNGNTLKNDAVNDDDPDSQIELVLTDPIDDHEPKLDLGNNKNIRLSCFAHSLQLVIRDGLTNVALLSKTLAKCKKLSKKSQKSTKIADLLDDVDMKIKRSNTTRWSSEFMLVRSILQLGRNTIEEITSIIGDDDLKFSNNDFNVLEELIDILEPFADITTSCQSEVVATISMVVPAIVHISHHLQQMMTKTSSLSKLICQLNRSINVPFLRNHQASTHETSEPRRSFSGSYLFHCNGFRSKVPVSLASSDGPISIDPVEGETNIDRSGVG